jgi:DNA-directed RNA polymerase specialized sigma24 family protein
VGRDETPVESSPAEEVLVNLHSKHGVAALYEQYGPVVYRRCLRLVEDADAARDATEEVFLAIVRNRAQLEDREVLPWIYRVATDHCLKLRRGVQSEVERAAGQRHIALRRAQ